jgi:hypothetical protein
MLRKAPKTVLVCENTCTRFSLSSESKNALRYWQTLSCTLQQGTRAACRISKREKIKLSCTLLQCHVMGAYAAVVVGLQAILPSALNGGIQLHTCPCLEPNSDSAGPPARYPVAVSTAVSSSLVRSVGQFQLIVISHQPLHYVTQSSVHMS